MDYLEGMLLHSWCSDTDYSSRKHTGTWYFYSFAMFIALAYVFAKLNLKGNLILLEKTSFFASMTVILFLITPLLCAIYYRVPFIFRLPILAVLAFKYICLFCYFILSLGKLLIIPEDITLSLIFDWGNKTVGDFLTETTARFKVSGLFIGGAIIASIVLAVGIILLLLVIYVPMLLLHAFNMAQMGWDTFVVFLYKKLKELYKAYKSKSTVNNGKESNTKMPKSGTIEG